MKRIIARATETVIRSMPGEEDCECRIVEIYVPTNIDITVFTTAISIARSIQAALGAPLSVVSTQIEEPLSTPKGP